MTPPLPRLIAQPPPCAPERGDPLAGAAELLSAVEGSACVVDARGRVLAVNREWRLFALQNGAHRATALGVGVDYLAVCRASPEPAAAAAAAGIATVLAGVEAEFQYVYPCHSETVARWYRMRVARLRHGGALIAHVDISAQRVAEQRLSIHTAIEEVLHHAGTTDVRGAALAACVQAIGWEAGAIWELDPGGETLRCTEVWSRSGDDDPMLRPRRRRVRRDEGLAGRVLATAQAGWTAEIHDEPSAPRQVAAGLVRSACAFPAMLGGRVGAVFELYSTRAHAPDPGLLATLGATGRQIGQFLQRRSAERRFREMFAQAKAGLFVLGADGRIVQVNRAAVALLGGAEVELSRLALADWLDVADRSLIGPPMRSTSVPCAATVRRRDGSCFPAVITVDLIHDVDGIHALLAVSDDTARKELEASLESARRLESIGQLAAGIAHEINTPMQYIGDNLGFLDKAIVDLTAVASGAAVPSPRRLRFVLDQAPKAVAACRQGVDRVTEIVRAMKGFSYLGGDEPEPVDVNGALTTTMTVSRNEWKYVAEVVTELAPDLPLIQGRPGPLNQAFLNLVVNAAHAIEDVVGDGAAGKGTITLRSRRDGAWIEVAIADTGTGIPDHVRHRIFEPFFTTKAVGKGTGQGLAMVRSVIRGHGGTLHFETAAGRGTTFVARLPIEGGGRGAVPEAR
ncbi:MAG: GAF domain-containing protein [Kofleriaceae bacterium]|nr:GAF domain-containing protein [Myxococcales bacterium]MCB9562631.1 GAF domain-containing protein [Kofleriaceae bacterium]MCB9574565.1 GAF domain-containing protein [Kofleriaceae bacterium]